MKRVSIPPAFSVICAGLFLAVVACTGGEPTPASTASLTPTLTTPVATPGQFATSTPRPAEPAGLNRGGVLRLAYSELPPHYDPHLSSSYSVISWGPAIVYSRLFRLQSGADIPAPSRLIECELCETWRFIGMTTIEIRLRESAVWQDIPPLDGRRVVAEDVVFSLDRIRTPGSANSSLLANIESVSATDDRTVLVTLRSPDAEIFEKLAHAAVRIVPPELVRQEGDLRNGPNIGSSPWVFEEISPTSMTIVADHDYWEEGLPYLDGLAIQYIPDPETRQSGVRNGFLDTDLSGAAEVRETIERFPDFVSLTIRQPDEGVEVALNTTREPLDSIELRQAIFKAWDPQAVIDTVWSGDAFVSLGLSPPTPLWLEADATALDGVFADPQGAVEIVSVLDLPGTPITIRVGDFSDRYVAHAEAMAAAMNDVGIAAEVEVVSTRVFGDEVWLTGDYDIMIGAPPPVAGLTARLLGVHHSGGPWNTTGYGTSALDSLIERQASETSLRDRYVSYVAIARSIAEGRHRFNSAAAIHAWVWRPAVRNFHPNTELGDTSFLLHTWLDR